MPPLTALLAWFSLTYGWSNSPSLNFSVRILVTAWLIRAIGTLPSATSEISAWFQPAESNGSIAMSTPALTASATAPARSGAMW